MSSGLKLVSESTGSRISTIVKNPIILVCLFLVIGGVLRVYRIEYQSLWTDETLTLIWSSGTFAKIFSNPFDGNNTPLYYLLINCVSRLGLSDLLTLRMPSAIFGTLTIWLTFVVVRAWLGNSTALIASLLMTLSPFHIWYSQEGRAYALLLFLSLLSLRFLQKLLENPESLLTRLLFVCTTALVFYVQIIGVAFLICLAIFVALLKRNSWKYWLQLAGAVLLLIAPAIFSLKGTLGTPANTFETVYPLSFTAYTVWVFITGYSLGPTLAELHVANPMVSVKPYLTVIIPIVSIICGLVSIAAYRMFKRDAVLCWTLVGWLSLPIALALLGDSLTTHSYNVRYAIVSLPAFLTLTAIGIGTAKSYWLRGVALLFVCVVSAFSLRNYYTNEVYHRDDNRAAGIVLARNALPGDRVIVSASYTMPNLEHYLGREDLDLVPYGESKRDEKYSRKFVESDLKRIISDRERFWVFLSRTYHSDPDGHISGYCDAHFARVFEFARTGVQLILYAKERDLAQPARKSHSAPSPSKRVP